MCGRLRGRTDTNSQRDARHCPPVPLEPDFVSVAPDALILVAPGCPHCRTTLDGLSALVKTGAIGRLEVVNITEHPDAAALSGARSVPWCRIGSFELDGAQTPAALRIWAEHTRNGTGMAAYFSELLQSQRLSRVEALLNQDPGQLPVLISLVADLNMPMAVRIGVGAVLEGLAGKSVLRTVITDLGALTAAAEPQIRADAAHYLGLTGSPDAIHFLMPLRDDGNDEVREIAEESLQLLRSNEIR